MKNFLYIVNKSKKASDSERYLMNLINQLKDCDHDFNYHNFNNIECLTYTNESISLNSLKHNYFFSFSGQLPKSEKIIEEEIQERGPTSMKGYISQLQGAHAISFAHLPSSAIYAYTTFSRVNPVYYLENDARIVIGIDPLIVNCVGWNSDSPIFDISRSVSFIVQGYFPDNNTLFKGVNAVPENSEISVKNNYIGIKDIDDSKEKMFTKKPTNQDYEELTNLYLHSFDVVPKVTTPHNLGLTGGKDSRLITLGLINKGIPFKASTRGFDDHPDVVIAKKVAKKLNIDHTVKRPVLNKENNLEIDLIDKILKVMIGTSGTVYGYENISYSPEYKGKIGITGVGAESIRGGYGNLRQKQRDNAGEELVKSFFSSKEYILPSKQADYENFLQTFGDNEKSFKEAQYKHYIFFRNGRWSGGARNSLLYSSNIFSPFFDNVFLKKVTELDVNILANEELHYNIMKRLNPELVKIPFYGSRWLFEEKGPKNPNEYRDWLNRNPVFSNTKIGAYNWRSLANDDDALRNAFRKILFSDPSSEIFSIVDHQKINNILKKPVPANLNRLMWGLVSVKVYIDYFANKLDYGFKKVEMKVPDSKIINIGNHPKIFDLTKILRPTNNAISIKQNEKDMEIKLNKKSDNNPYLQTGEESFTTPPTKHLNMLSINDKMKKIFVRFCLESPTLGSEYKLFVMFYNETERIYSKAFPFVAKGKRIFLEKNIPIIENTKFVKFAIKIDTKTVNNPINLKYGYMKLI